MEHLPNWYMLSLYTSKADHIGTITNNPDVVYTVSLTIPKFKLLLQTYVMNRESVNPCKHAVIEVPDTQFKIKLCFLGKYFNYMEIYYLSTISCTVKTNMVLTKGAYCKNYRTKNYIPVLENKWNQIRSEYVVFGDDPNNDLSLCFDFIVAQDSDTANDSCSKNNQLGNDLGMLFLDGIYADAIIKSVEGQEFGVHKNILAVRSKVMKAHFEHQSIESITNIVETKWGTNILSDLLTFMYTGKAPQVDSDPAKLLAAADYYQVEGLKELCERALTKRLTIENAIETLQLAELHSANTLRENILEFISQGRARLITETEGWANIKYELLKMIFEYITAHEKEDYNILQVAAAEVQ